MDAYNKIMIYVWGFIAVGSAIFITYMGFVQGFSEWYQFYLFTAIAVLMIVVKKGMTKRYKKHLEEIEKNKK